MYLFVGGLFLNRCTVELLLQQCISCFFGTGLYQVNGRGSGFAIRRFQVAEKVLLLSPALRRLCVLALPCTQQGACTEEE